MTTRTAINVVASIVGVAVLVCGAAWTWMRFAPRHVPPGQPPLSRLDAASLPAFKSAFNASAGDVRVLALLSPT